MKPILPSLLAIAWLSLSICASAHAAGTEDSLRSSIYHESDEVFQKDGCTWKAGLLLQKGSRVLDVFPVADIKSVEVQGDEVTLPTALVMSLLTEGRFEETKHLIAVGEAPAGRIRLKNGNCLQFNALIDPAGRSVSGIETGIGEVSVPGIPDKCKSSALQVKQGMTRAEVGKSFSPDGGIAVPFRYERYVAQGSGCGTKGEVIKVNIAFKPAGMTDAVYFLGKWAPPKQSPQDVVMRLSPVYLERPYFD